MHTNPVSGIALHHDIETTVSGNSVLSVWTTHLRARLCADVSALAYLDATNLTAEYFRVSCII